MLFLYPAVGYFVWLDLLRRFTEKEAWALIRAIAAVSVGLTVLYCIQAMHVKVYPYAPYLVSRDYWYYFAEHVCFFSEPWFRWAAARADLGIEEVTRFSRYPADRIGTPFVELASACAFRFLGGPRSLPVRLARRAHMLRRHVETQHWRDHILVVLRKRPGHGLVEGS